MSFSHDQIERSSSYVAEKIAEQMLHHFYEHGGNPKLVKHEFLKERIEQVWLKWKGTPYFPTKPIPLGVVGKPGEGKSSSMREATKIVAGLLDMNISSKPPVGDVSNTLFCYSVAMSGEMTKTPLKGILMPQISPDGETIMKKIKPDWERWVQEYPLSFIYLDDFMNTNPEIRTAGYDILLPENDYDGVQAYVCFTGNTGKDGAAAKKPSTAEFSRCRIIYQSDSAVEFVSRLQSKYRDEVGCCYLDSFISSHPEERNNHLDMAMKHNINFACSRTWDYFAEQARPIMHQFLYRQKADQDTPFPLQELRMLAEDLVGFESAAKYVGFVNEFRKNIQPLVDSIFAKGNVSDVRNEIDNRYGDGIASSSIAFKYSFSVAVAQKASDDFIKANIEDRPEVLKRLATAMFDTLPSAEYMAFTSRLFVSNLIAKIEDPEIGYISRNGRVMITESFKHNLISASLGEKKAIALVDGIKIDNKDVTKDELLFQKAFGELSPVDTQDSINFHKEKIKLQEIINRSKAIQATAAQKEDIKVGAESQVVSNSQHVIAPAIQPSIPVVQLSTDVSGSVKNDINPVSSSTDDAEVPEPNPGMGVFVM